VIDPEQSSDAATDNPALQIAFSGLTTPDVSNSMEYGVVRLADDLPSIRTGPSGKPRKSEPFASNSGCARQTPVEGGHPRITSIPAAEKAHVTASSFLAAVRPSGGVHAAASAGAIACS
jgi:hypothetical protein